MPSDQAAERLARIDDEELMPLDPMDDGYYKSIVMMPDPIPEIQGILENGSPTEQELWSRIEQLHRGKSELAPQVIHDFKVLAQTNPDLMEALKRYAAVRLKSKISDPN